MMLILLAAIVIIMGRAFLPQGEPLPEPLRVNIAQLGVGGTQGIEWNHQRLLAVHTAQGEHYLVIADYDPIYGCPMRWVAPADKEAPFQPWPGGLRAICTDHWFDATGAALTEGVINLKRIPFTLERPDNLVIAAETK